MLAGIVSTVPARSPIHVAFDRFGRDAGMELHRRAWYWRTEEVIVTCDLQKSQYGPSYYLNVGFYFRSIGNETHPKSSKCDIPMRAERLIGGQSGLSELLDLDKPIADDDRSLRLYTLLSDRLTPQIKKGATVEGLKEMLADGSLPRTHLGGNAQAVLLAEDN
jgi:hypothetical protein